MVSLAEQISNLANPNPVFDDPEDIVDDTGAKLIVSHYDEDDDLPLEGATRLRSRAAAMMGDDDTKYAGKRTSRKRVHQAAILTKPSDSDGDEEEEADEDNSSDDADQYTESDVTEQDQSDDVIHSDEEDEQIAGFKEKMMFQNAATTDGKEFSFDAGADFGQYADDFSEADSDDDDDDDENNEEGDEDGSVDDDSEGEDEEEDMEEDGVRGGVQQFTKVNVEDEIQKGKAVRSQLGIWDSLLEARIKLQKVLVAANQLPQPDKWVEFTEAGGMEYQKALVEGQGFLQKLLEQLVSLQSVLLHQNSETRQLTGNLDGLAKSKGKASSDSKDEEITSESDIGSDEDGSQSESVRQILKRKLGTKEYPDFIAKRHSHFRSYRNVTIQKWFDKMRVASGRLGKGFSGFEQSAVKQIDQILSDKGRLIRRTQLKRSAYNILGKPMESQTEVGVEDDIPQDQLTASRDHLKHYDTEIFDDDDFYHQLLRELIERKTSDISDPVALSRQWLQIQKLRSKSKKVVDRKASKGRKIRYNIHSKLVNFMAPVETSQWSDEAKNELYKSLFGKASDSTLEGKR